MCEAISRKAIIRAAFIRPESLVVQRTVRQVLRVIDLVSNWLPVLDLVVREECVDGIRAVRHGNGGSGTFSGAVSDFICWGTT